MKGYYVLKLVCQAGVSLMVLSCVMNEANQTSMGVHARKPLGSRNPPGSPSTEDDYFEESYDHPHDDQYANYNDERRDSRSTQRAERRNREQDFEDYPEEETENFDETYLGQN